MKLFPRQVPFVWLAAGILLPVFVLAGLAFLSLSSDWRSAKVEAREQARLIADSLSVRLSEDLGQTLTDYIQKTSQWRKHLDRVADPVGPASSDSIDYNATIQQWTETVPWSGLEPPPLPEARFVEGRLIDPPDYDSIPQPPDWLSDMTQDQLTALENSLDSSMNGMNEDTSDLNPLLADPELARELRLVIRYRVLRDRTRNSTDTVPLSLWMELIEETQDIAAPSGTPLADLAWLVVWRGYALADIDSEVLSRFATHVSLHPSFLTSRLLELASEMIQVAPAKADSVAFIEATETRWRSDQRTRALLRGFFQQLDDPAQPGAVWLKSSSGTFLAVWDPSEPDGESGFASSASKTGSVRLFPESFLEQAMQQTGHQLKRYLPEYADIRVRWMGKTYFNGGIEESVSGSFKDNFEILASAQGVIGDGLSHPDAHPFQIEIVLSNPELFHARQRSRVVRYGSLIGFAMLTTVLAVGGLDRIHRRQNQLNDMKTNFVSSVSHELRAPIASVRLMAESLNTGRVHEPARQREYFGLIVRECRRLSSLIANVLDFSRIERNRKNYEFAEADVERLVVETVALMRLMADDRSVRIELETEGADLMESDVMIDSQAIQQALVNLIDNAIKHSPENGLIRVILSIQSIDPNSSQAETPGEGNPKSFCLAVEDTGPGIPRKERKAIFERFHRLGSELHRETTGVGIGLSIVKHIVETHGGRIDVEDNPGGGSRFVMRIPNPQHLENRTPGE